MAGVDGVESHSTALSTPNISADSSVALDTVESHSTVSKPSIERFESHSTPRRVTFDAGESKCSVVSTASVSTSCQMMS